MLILTVNKVLSEELNDEIVIYKQQKMFWQQAVNLILNRRFLVEVTNYLCKSKRFYIYY
jgi:hypothetical protein